MKIVIVNYDLGNLHSLENAFIFCGQQPVISRNPAELGQADALILPGVGAFGDGMRLLRSYGLDEAVLTFAEKRKPILGICLGMQLLMDNSEEFGMHDGLGLIAGTVRYFYNFDGFDGSCKVPSIGWNEIIPTTTKSPLLTGLTNYHMYFVHSLCVTTVNKNETIASASYGGINYSAVIAKGNIYGCQFHPEKSATAGLRIIQNFLNIVEICT